MSDSQITRKNLALYGILAFPLAFAGLPVYVHAPDFYATHLSLPLTSIGLTLLFLRIIDAVQDPLFGILSDRFHTWRRTILIIGMVLLGGGFWMIFHPHSEMPLLWLALSVFVCTSGFSLVSINFQSLGGLWKASHHERTLITSWREAIGLVGLLMASIVPSLLLTSFEPPFAFHVFSLIYLPVLIVIALLFFQWMQRANFAAPANELKPFSLSSWRVSSWKRSFFPLFLISNLASAIPAVLVLFFIRDRLESEAWTGLFLLLYFLSGALSMPFWQKISRLTSKPKSWLFSMLLAVATFIWAFSLESGDALAYGFICVFSGMALGADLALPPSMMADHIRKENREHEASRHFAAMTFLSKAALALATGMTLPLLGLSGYVPGDVESYAITRSLSYAYALIPCLIKSVVAFWLWRRISVLDIKDTSHETLR